MNSGNAIASRYNCYENSIIFKNTAVPNCAAVSNEQLTWFSVTINAFPTETAAVNQFSPLFFHRVVYIFQTLPPILSHLVGRRQNYGTPTLISIDAVRLGVIYVYDRNSYLCDFVVCNSNLSLVFCFLLL